MNLDKRGRKSKYIVSQNIWKKFIQYSGSDYQYETKNKSLFVFDRFTFYSGFSPRYFKDGVENSFVDCTLFLNKELIDINFIFSKKILDEICLDLYPKFKNLFIQENVYNKTKLFEDTGLPRDASSQFFNVELKKRWLQEYYYIKYCNKVLVFRIMNLILPLENINKIEQICNKIEKSFKKILKFYPLYKFSTEL